MINSDQIITAFLRKLKKNRKFEKWSFGHGEYIPHIRAIEKWLINYSSNKGIYLNNGEPIEYPEVTGYWLETLLKWGFREKADSWYQWLVSIQHKDGGWPDFSLGTESFFFDSGQIIRGIKYYSDATGVDASPTIKKYLQYFDANFEKNLIPKKGEPNVDWHLINLQVAWIVHKYWPEHVSTAWLKKELGKYLQEWTPGRLISHFDIYIMEAIFELGLYPNKFIEFIEYFDIQVAKYGLVPDDSTNAAPCYTACAQLSVLYYKMGRTKDGGNLLFRMLQDLDLMRGNWPGSGEGGNYHVNREISWGLKYFLDALYSYSTEGFDLDASGEWNQVDNEFLERLLQAVTSRSQNSSRILDVGCGLGRYLEPLKKNGHQVYGVDISAHNVRICQDKKINASVTSFTELRLSKNFPKNFDVIFSIEAFEHAVFPINALKQAASRLSDTGKIIIIDKDFFECLSYQLCPFESYYTRPEMRKLASKSGLAVVHFEKIGPFLLTEMVKKP